MPSSFFYASDRIEDAVVTLSKRGMPALTTLKIRVTQQCITREDIVEANDVHAQIESTQPLVQSLVGRLEGFLKLTEIVAGV